MNGASSARSRLCDYGVAVIPDYRGSGVVDRNCAVSPSQHKGLSPVCDQDLGVQLAWSTSPAEREGED